MEEKQHPTNFLTMKTVHGTFYLYGFIDRQEPDARHLRASHKRIEFQGSLYEMRDRVRLAKKLVPAKKLLSQDGKKLEVYYNFVTDKYFPHSPTSGMATAVTKLQNMIGKKLNYFIATREEL